MIKRIIYIAFGLALLLIISQQFCVKRIDKMIAKCALSHFSPINTEMVPAPDKYGFSFVNWNLKKQTNDSLRLKSRVYFKSFQFDVGTNNIFYEEEKIMICNSIELAIKREYNYQTRIEKYYLCYLNNGLESEINKHGFDSIIQASNPIIFYK